MFKGAEDFQVFKDDPYLKPHVQHFRVRFESYTKILKELKTKE